LKISNREAYQSAKLTEGQFYALKKQKPRLVELLKKGLLAEKLLKEEIFETMIKGNNKR